jgi:hypothetical protein
MQELGRQPGLLLHVDVATPKLAFGSQFCENGAPGSI